MNTVSSNSDIVRLRLVLDCVRMRSKHLFLNPLRVDQPARGFTDDWRMYPYPLALSLNEVIAVRVTRFIQLSTPRTLLSIDTEMFTPEGNRTEPGIHCRIFEPKIAQPVVEEFLHYAEESQTKIFMGVGY